eukprot:scaffold115609_cov30-Tisochrysis_lutea.AAC.1
MQMLSGLTSLCATASAWSASSPSAVSAIEDRLPPGKYSSRSALVVGVERQPCNATTQGVARTPANARTYASRCAHSAEPEPAAAPSMVGARAQSLTSFSTNGLPPYEHSTSRDGPA